LAQRRSERPDEYHGPSRPPLSPSSVRWLAETPLARRKPRGQYLTPRPVAEELVDRIPLEPGMKVLDPGVGTGELLAAVARRRPDARLAGWDIDPTALAAARELVPGADLELRSALDPIRKEAGAGGSGAGFDLVIGNPPYFQVPVTPELKARFGEVISGRANVFTLFFKAGLDLLAPGGTLAFVVPPSMNSGAYFEALREHVVSRARITDLTVLEGSGIFEGANTAAQLLVLRKHGEPGSGVVPDPEPEGRDKTSRPPFVFERRDDEAGFRRVIFTGNPEELEAGFAGRQTLWQLGYEAVTGTVVWNQHREALSQEARPGTVPLVWSGDLRGGVLDLEPGCDGRRRAPAESKPGFVAVRVSLTGPALLVNRVVGSVGRGELRTGLVPPGADFVAENHVNVVRPRSGVRQQVSPEELQQRLEAPGVVERLRQLTGNTQISATELTHLLPV
jgi:adenine-specific DNA-methyltransferase